MAIDDAFGDVRKGIRQAGGRAILIRYVGFVTVREADGQTSREITAPELSRLISILERMN